MPQPINDYSIIEEETPFDLSCIMQAQHTGAAAGNPGLSSNVSWPTTFANGYWQYNWPVVLLVANTQLYS